LLRKDDFERVIRGKCEATGSASCVFDLVGTGRGIDVACMGYVNADGGFGVVGKAGSFHGTPKDFGQAPGLPGGQVQGVAGDFG